jgi:hypothetical protein
MSGIYGTNGANRAAAAGKINGYSDLKPLKQLNSSPLPMKTGNDDKELNKKLNNALAKTPVDEQMPNKASLKRAGFKADESGVIDMNGGQYYIKPGVGTIRIAGWHGNELMGSEGSSSVSFTSSDGKLKNEILYDPDGNPMKGILTVENEDGFIETYKFEYDIEGNKKVTSYQKEVKD